MPRQLLSRPPQRGAVLPHAVAHSVMYSFSALNPCRRPFQVSPLGCGGRKPKCPRCGSGGGVQISCDRRGAAAIDCLGNRWNLETRTVRAVLCADRQAQRAETAMAGADYRGAVFVVYRSAAAPHSRLRAAGRRSSCRRRILAGHWLFHVASDFSRKSAD